MRCRFGLLTVLCLTGCGERYVKPSAFDAVPVPVEIVTLQYITVPDYLTEPLPIAAPLNLTCGEAVRVARERRTTLERANADRAATRELNGKAVKP